MRGHLPVYRFIWMHLCWCNIHSLTTEERLHSMKALIKIKFTFSDIFKKCFLWRTTAEAALTFRNTAKSTFWNSLYYSWTWQIWEIHKGTDLQFLKKRVDVFDIKNNIQINLEQNLNERLDYTPRYTSDSRPLHACIYACISARTKYLYCFYVGLNTAKIHFIYVSLHFHIRNVCMLYTGDTRARNSWDWRKTGSQVIWTTAFS